MKSLGKVKFIPRGRTIQGDLSERINGDYFNKFGDRLYEIFLSPSLRSLLWDPMDAIKRRFNEKAK